MVKLIQWSEPETFGEDQFVPLLGALDTEMVVWKTFSASRSILRLGYAEVAPAARWQMCNDSNKQDCGLST